MWLISVGHYEASWEEVAISLDCVFSRELGRSDVGDANLWKALSRVEWRYIA